MKLLTKEHTTYKELDACLQEQRRKVRSMYWDICKKMQTQEYNSSANQLSDQVALGKLAIAEQNIVSALSALSDLPRK